MKKGDTRIDQPTPTSFQDVWRPSRNHGWLQSNQLPAMLSNDDKQTFLANDEDFSD